MKRRQALVAIGLGVMGAAIPARVFAGSYLDRAGILVFEANKATEFLRGRLYDGELARVVHKGALARIKIAGEMMVPPEVVLAHPHLLLVLERHERAANAAVEKAAKDFLRYLGQAREEERLFRAVLKQLGWELPEVG